MADAEKPIRALEYRARVDGRTLDEAEYARLCWGAVDARWRHRSPTRAEFLRFATQLALERASRMALTKRLNLREEVARRAAPRDARRLAAVAGAPSPRAADDSCSGTSLSDWLRQDRDEGPTIR